MPHEKYCVLKVYGRCRKIKFWEVNWFLSHPGLENKTVRPRKNNRGSLLKVTTSEYWSCYWFQTALLGCLWGQPSSEVLTTAVCTAETVTQKHVNTLKTLCPFAQFDPCRCVKRNTHGVSVGDLGTALGRCLQVEFTVRTLTSSWKRESQIKWKDASSAYCLKQQETAFTKQTSLQMRADCLSLPSG